MKMVLGTLVYIIIIIVVIIVIIALLKFLFQLFFVIPVGTDYSADLLYARDSVTNELDNIVFDGTIFVVIVSWTPATYDSMVTP